MTHVNGKWRLSELCVCAIEEKPKICAKKGNSSQTDVIQTSGCAAHTQNQMLSCGTDCAVQTDVSMLTFAAMQAEIMQLQLKNYQQVEEIQQLQVKKLPTGR